MPEVWVKAKTEIGIMDELEEWNTLMEILSNYKKIGGFLLRVVSLVEMAVKELGEGLVDLQSEEKLQAAAEFLDYKLQLNCYLAVMDGPTIKLSLSTMVWR